MVLTRRWLALAFAACTSVSGAAMADAESDKIAAAALADAALLQLERGDTRTALDLFARASSLVPAPSFALYEARCLVALDRLDEADRAYTRAEGFDDRPSATPAQRQAITEARIEHAALRRKREAMPRPAEPRPVPPVPTLTARATPPPSPAAQPDAPPRGAPLASLVALGAGAAGVTVGVISGIVMLAKKSDLDGACPNGRCTAQNSDQLDAYRSARTVSTVAWGVGIVGLGVGAGIWLAAPPAHGARSGSVVVLVGPTSAAVSGTF